MFPVTYFSATIHAHSMFSFLWEVMAEFALGSSGFVCLRIFAAIVSAEIPSSFSQLYPRHLQRHSAVYSHHRCLHLIQSHRARYNSESVRLLIYFRLPQKLYHTFILVCAIARMSSYNKKRKTPIIIWINVQVYIW